MLHLMEADDVRVHQQSVVQDFPIHIDVDLQLRDVRSVSGLVTVIHGNIPKHHCDTAEVSHHAAALNELAGHKLPRCPLAQQHRDAIVATAQLADLEEQSSSIACMSIRPQGILEELCSLRPAVTQETPVGTHSCMQPRPRCTFCLQQLATGHMLGIEHTVRACTKPSIGVVEASGNGVPGHTLRTSVALPSPPET